MSNFIKNVVVNTDSTVGKNLYFKRFLTLVFRYENGEKTEEIIGYKVLVESEITRSNLVLKVNTSISEAEFNALVGKEENYYNKLVNIREPKLVAYAQKNSVRWSFQCSRIGFKNE